MVDIFYPEKLDKVKYEIAKVHKSSGELSEDKINSNEFKAIVKRISALKGDELRAFALCISKKDLIMLAHYAPRNVYKGSLKKITAVLSFNPSDEVLNALFSSWQNNYESSNGEVIFTVINRYQGSTKKFKDLFKLSLDKLAEAIKEGVVDSYLSNIVFDKGIRTYDRYSACLEDMKINKDSLLGKQLSNLFYLGCSKEEYLRLKPHELLEIVNKLTYDHSKKLLLNLLEVCDIKDLKPYNNILIHYLKTTGKEGTKEFKGYFNGIDPVTVRKYITWINIYDLENIFGNDERSRFWSQYADRCIVRHHPNTRSLTMEFDTFAVVEFRRMGPIYWFDLEYFNKEVYRRCQNLTSEANLRDWLYHSKKYKERKVHHKDIWTIEARRYTNKLLMRS
ncbi:hypothetical protein ACPWSR_13205 [Alloiococcus sp. CFN-8]|uniref:hypothetical protein n=1 Tax=Alloiococcus sp. CFN-8 TaxID=3416081 RepID=UPI003CF18FEA